MLWLVLVSSALLTFGLAARGIATRSWKLVWVAAFCALPWTLLGYSVGSIALLVALQLAAVSLGLRWHASPRAWLLVSGFGLLVWAVIPGQALPWAGTSMASPPWTVIPVILWLLAPLAPVLSARHGDVVA